MRILIENGIIVTMDPSRSIIHDGGIFIEQNTISDVGPSARLRKDYDAEIVIDASEKAVFPGLINAHTHLSEKLVTGIVDDLPLFDWLDRLINPLIIHSTEDDCYWSALLGQVEMIKSGITCFADLFDASHRRILEKLTQTVELSKMRGVLARGIADCELPEEFPDDLSANMIQDTVEAITNRKRKTDDRVHIRFGIGAMFCSSPDLLKEIRKLAHEYEVGIHTHFSESAEEVKDLERVRGMRTIQYAHKNGVLGPDVMGAHCIWLSEEEIELFRRTDTKAIYCPVSNMKLADGVAPVPRMLKEGITVGLGTDGAGSNDNLDLITCMKFGSYLQKIHQLDASLLPSQRILEIATIDGAKALQLDRQIGSLEVGKRADLIVVNLTDPNMAPVHDVVKQFVCSGQPGNVDTVIIDGTVVMENREIRTVDESMVVHKAWECAMNLLDRIGLDR
ncbi:MAG: amidohydrolase family protein [Candidatus Hodarchaeota archaeon]